MRHWWNGEWPIPHSSNRRRDIWLCEDRVAAVDASGERWWQLGSPEEALAFVADLMSDSPGWREMKVWTPVSIP